MEGRHIKVILWNLKESLRSFWDLRNTVFRQSETWNWSLVDYIVLNLLLLEMEWESNEETVASIIGYLSRNFKIKNRDGGWGDWKGLCILYDVFIHCMTNELYWFTSYIGLVYDKKRNL